MEFTAISAPDESDTGRLSFRCACQAAPRGIKTAAKAAVNAHARIFLYKQKFGEEHA